MEKLRIGIVGAGNIAQSAHLPAYMERDDVEIVAIADLNLQRAKDAAALFGVPNAYETVDELLANAEVDAIDICVWNRSHSDVAIKAARAGKHILCEKPMALNMEHAYAMKDAVEKAGVIFMMAMPNRYRSEYMLVREMVDADELGEIYYAKAVSVRRRGTPLGWFTDTKKSGGGPVIDIGVHCVDRTWFLMGCPKPVRVSAMTSSRIGDYQTKGVDRWIALDSDVTAFDTEDSAAAIIHFENGACMLVETSWALNTAPEDYTLVCGTKAGARIDDDIMIYGEVMGYLTDNKPTVKKNNPFAEEIDHFIDCVRTGKPVKSTLNHGLEVQKMLCGIYESAEKKREITL